MLFNCGLLNHAFTFCIIFQLHITQFQFWSLYGHRLGKIRPFAVPVHRKNIRIRISKSRLMSLPQKVRCKLRGCSHEFRLTRFYPLRPAFNGREIRETTLATSLRIHNARECLIQQNNKPISSDFQSPCESRISLHS